MSSYFVRFKGGVDRLRKPDGFPEEISLSEQYRNVENCVINGVVCNSIAEVVNTRFQQLVNSPGIVILKDPNEIIDAGKVSFNKRIFIPWHMITYFALEEPKIITEILPPPSQALIENAEEVEPEGNPPVVN